MRHTLFLHRAALVAAPVLLAACGADAPADGGAAGTADDALIGRVEIAQPADGETVDAPNVPVVLRAEGVVVEPAQGERVPGRGHHHLFVDRDVTPRGEPIPRQVDGIIHLGTGAGEFVVKDLAPGEHRIIAVLAYGDHVPMERVATDTVRVVVRPE